MSQRDWVDKDFYATLGVRPEATETEIKKAYRKLAHRYHPDANPGDKVAEEKFKELSEAHDVLGDSDKRRQYDQMREMLRSGFGRFRAGAQEVRFEDLNDLFGGGSPFEDILGSFFGSGPRRARGADLESVATVEFTDALEGTTLDLQISDPAAGRRRVKARIPPGVGDGARIRLPRKGSPGFGGGPPGDLYVRVRVKSHPVFGRKGQDLTVDVPISFPEAVLGAEVEVPTLNGRVRLKVPKGTPSGKTFRIRGKGPEIGGRRRDLLATVNVAVPSKLSKKAKDLLEQFAAEQSESPRGEK